MTRRKRANHEGTLSKRNDGREKPWAAQYPIGPTTKTKYFATNIEGSDWLFRMRKEIEAGLTADPSRPKVVDQLKKWFLGMDPIISTEIVDGQEVQIVDDDSYRPTTYVLYQSILERFIYPYFEKNKIKLIDLKRSHITKFFESEDIKKLSSAYKRIARNILLSAFNNAKDLGLLTENPATQEKKPTRKRKKHHDILNPTLTREQVGRFISVAIKKPTGLFFIALLLTGLRKSELLASRWIDLSWATCRLRVAYQVQNIRRQGTNVYLPKSDAGNREAPICFWLLEMLKIHLEEQNLFKNNLRNRKRWREKGLIFPSCVGTHWGEANARRDYKEILKEAELPANTTIHSLRKAYGRGMVFTNIHPKVVQELLGHADIRTTMLLYSSVEELSKDLAAEAIEAYMLPPEILGLVKRNRPGENTDDDDDLVPALIPA